MSFYEEIRIALPPALPDYLKSQRWFGGKARTIRSTEILDSIALPSDHFEAYVLIVAVEFSSGAGEKYVVPVVRAEGRTSIAPDEPTLKAHSDSRGLDLVFTNALSNDEFLSALLEIIRDKGVVQGAKGEIRASRTNALQELRSVPVADFRPKLLKGEQSNSSVIYGDRFILKMIRRMEEGIHPDLEMGFFLSEKAHFKNVPPLAGSLEYQANGGSAATVGILQGLVPNQVDAWHFTLNALSGFWQEVSKSAAGPPFENLSGGGPQPGATVPELARKLIGPYMDAVHILGARTAEMHLALSSEPHDPAFAPEPFTPSFQREFEESARELTERNLEILRGKMPELAGNIRQQAEDVLGRQAEILRQFHSTLSTPIKAVRTRIHGDYHLGQVLYTGSDFMIIDFEGEPTRPLRERRVKRSPLQDVAGMMRSFHYAPFASLLAPVEGAPVAGEELHRLIPWAEAWSAWVMAEFLKSYFENSGSAAHIPSGREELAKLLRIHLLEKAIYELGYELNNRPAWVGIPLAGISRLLKTAT